MRNALWLAVLTASLSASPSFATQGMSCRAADGGAEISMSLGTAGGLSIVGASMHAGEERWVTDPAYGEGALFTVGQSFSDEAGLKADFFDDIVNERVAELRLVRAQESNDWVLAGTLRILGVGVWPVACDEQ